MKLALLLLATLSSSYGFSPLLLRRSVVKYDTSKSVPSEVVDKALEAAIMAPNHFLVSMGRVERLFCRVTY